MIKLYLNNDTTGIEITSFNHSCRRNEGNNFREDYNIILADTTNIDILAHQFDNILITDIVLKKDEQIIKTITNLNLYISIINE
jgi:hypothetical protein